MRSRPRRCFLALILALVPAAAALAQPARGPALPQLLAEDTVFYVSVDPARAAQGVSSLDLAALLREPEVQQFLAPLWQALGVPGSQDPVATLLGRLPVSQFLAGEAAAGLSGLSVEAEGADGSLLKVKVAASSPLTARMLHQLAMIARQAEGAPACARVSVDFLAAIEPGPALRKMALDFLAAPPPGFAASEMVLAGAPVRVLTIHAPDGPTTTLYGDLSGARWLIGGDQESFAAALAGGPAKSLQESATFTNFARRAAGEGNVLFAFADCARLLATLENLVPPIALEEASILGLDSLQGLAVGISLVEGGVRESLLLGFDGRPRGVFSLFDALGGGFPALAEAQPGTIAFVGLRFDANVLKERLFALLGDVAPGAGLDLAAQAGQLKAGQLDLLDDILPALGSELTVSMIRPHAGLIPDVVFSLEMRDEQKASTVLDELCRMAAAQGEVSIREIPLNDGKPGFAVTLPDAPLQPAFALRGKRLYGAISALTLRNHLRRQMSLLERPAPAAGSDVARRVLNGLTNGRPELLTMLLYVDLKNTLPILYDAVGPFAAPALAESQIPLDPVLLPLSETLADHLSGIAIGLSSGPEGISLDVFTPAGLAPLGVLAAILEQHCQASRPNRPRQACLAERAPDCE
ncbi:MAG: hypothetical protein HY812_02170 [Planctomycetes bacterium]|nr:hypothetical protein [Planctomycetota bacterium]